MSTSGNPVKSSPTKQLKQKIWQQTHTPRPLFENSTRPLVSQVNPDQRDNTVGSSSSSSNNKEHSSSKRKASISIAPPITNPDKRPRNASPLSRPDIWIPLSKEIQKAIFADKQALDLSGKGKKPVSKSLPQPKVSSQTQWDIDFEYACETAPASQSIGLFLSFILKAVEEGQKLDLDVEQESFWELFLPLLFRNGKCPETKDVLRYYLTFIKQENEAWPHSQFEVATSKYPETYQTYLGFLQGAVGITNPRIRNLPRIPKKPPTPHKMEVGKTTLPHTELEFPSSQSDSNTTLSIPELDFGPKGILQLEAKPPTTSTVDSIAPLIAKQERIYANALRCNNFVTGQGEYPRTLGMPEVYPMTGGTLPGKNVLSPEDFNKALEDFNGQAAALAQEYKVKLTGLVNNWMQQMGQTVTNQIKDAIMKLPEAERQPTLAQARLKGEEIAKHYETKKANSKSTPTQSEAGPSRGRTYNRGRNNYRSRPYSGRRGHK